MSTQSGSERLQLEQPVQLLDLSLPPSGRAPAKVYGRAYELRPERGQWFWEMLSSFAALERPCGPARVGDRVVTCTEGTRAAGTRGAACSGETVSTTSRPKANKIGLDGHVVNGRTHTGCGKTHQHFMSPRYVVVSDVDLWTACQRRP